MFWLIKAWRYRQFVSKFCQNVASTYGNIIQKCMQTNNVFMLQLTKNFPLKFCT